MTQALLIVNKRLFFGGDGIIAENLRPQQDKLIKYNQLVSNMVILHNAENMTRSLKKFVKEGHELTPEMLAGLSPYRRAHINRFGDYHMDINRNISPIGTPLIFPENNRLNIEISKLMVFCRK
tara:strand:+ start:6607 stop:6975 length:369 start_codon:yes stop_codon:yes gene_type:complete